MDLGNLSQARVGGNTPSIEVPTSWNLSKSVYVLYLPLPFCSTGMGRSAALCSCS